MLVLLWRLNAEHMNRDDRGVRWNRSGDPRSAHCKVDVDNVDPFCAWCRRYPRVEKFLGTSENAVESCAAHVRVTAVNK